jgi:hypothetical protein
VPDGVNADRVEAYFKNGVLTVTLPKTKEAQKKEKRIEIKLSSPSRCLRARLRPGRVA